MSHFTVTVALPGHIDPEKLEEALDAVMAPYDENIVMDQYVKATREQLIEGEKENFLPGGFWHDIIEEYQEDPAKYRAKTLNPGHLRRIEELIEQDRINNFSDDQWYTEAIRYYGPEDLGPNGEVYSTYNPKSEWDWFSIGGRWGGRWTLKDHLDPSTYPGMGTQPSAFGMSERAEEDARNTDCARAQDIVPESHNSSYAYVDLEGEWISRGKMGWWGMSSDDKAEEAWDKQYFEWLKSLPQDTWLVNVDCHI